MVYSHFDQQNFYSTLIKVHSYISIPLHCLSHYTIFFFAAVKGNDDGDDVIDYDAISHRLKEDAVSLYLLTALLSIELAMGEIL